MMKRISNFFRILGPGLLFAGAAIGVSHLVQSTRAGAEFGFALVIFLVLANIFKYPFFEFGSRYTAATGKSLLHGYQKLGSWALPLFTLFTLASMFIIAAAVVIVTSGLAIQVSGIHVDALYWNFIVVGVAVALLIVGRFSWLQALMKVVVIVLGLTTLVTLIFAIVHGGNVNPGFIKPSIWNAAGVAFLIALMGWMPAPIEISVWHSVWAVERKKSSGQLASRKEASIDFNVGYIGTAIMALIFLSLGALVLYGSGEIFEESAAGFAGQLIDIYTSTLGPWAWWIIAIAALTTMFSTTLTVFDAYPRVMQHIMKASKLGVKQSDRTWYVFWLVTLAAGSLVILSSFGGNMKSLIMFTTIMSFLTAPLLAYMNYRVVTDTHMPIKDRPKKSMRVLSWFGMTFLVGFSLLYIVWQILLS